MAKILLLDDDEVLLRMYRQKFTNEGFQVDTAADARRFLKNSKTPLEKYIFSVTPLSFLKL